MKVNWNEKSCQHAGVCVKTLPNVFKIQNDSFVIDVTAASEQDIKTMLEKCPSGALTAAE